MEHAYKAFIEYWVEWVCVGVTSVLTFVYRQLIKKYEEEKALNHAMREGIKALLHDRLIDRCELCLNKKYCTTEELKEILYMYEPYKALNGNGTVDRALDQVKALPHK